MSGLHHGGSGTTYSYHGCRCEVCTAAHNARVGRRRAERLEARVERDGRMVATADVKHGTVSTYSNWGCRCDPCSEATARRNAARVRVVAS